LLQEIGVQTHLSPPVTASRSRAWLWNLPPPIWVPLATAVSLAVPGLIALLAHEPVLFASLGPTALMIAQQPMLASTRPYNAIVGHLIGLSSGFLAVALLGIASEPSIFQSHTLTATRLAAALLAISMDVTLEVLLRAQHPPTAATCLLAALGSFRPGWHDTLVVTTGVVAVTVTAELLRRLHAAQPPPTRHPPPRP